MSEENARRTDWIDFAKGFVMIAVVEGHATFHFTPANEFFATFRMPFFFIMAGFLLNFDKWGGKENYKKFLVKLFKRLLLPYYLAELLFFPIWYFLCYKADFGQYMWRWAYIENPLDALAAIFVGNHNDGPLLLIQLWFLPALLFAEIIFINLYNRFKKIGAGIFVAVAICAIIGFNMKKFFVLPMGADIALVAQVFILAGVLLRRHKICERLDFKICAGLILLLVAAFRFNILVSMDLRQYGDPLLFYVGGIAGTLLVMKISILLTKLGGTFCAVMNSCGRQSMAILIFHPLFISMTYDLLDAAKVNPDLYLTDPRIVFAVTAAGSLLPVFVAKRFGKLPLLRFFCA